MLTSLTVRLVDVCRRFAVFVVLLAAATSVGLGWYVAAHIKINTDVNQLLAADLDWREREVELEQAFPQNTDRLVAVVDGLTPDAAENGAATLASKMRERPDLFRNVTRPEAIPFFRHNGLLFLSEEELSATLETLIQAQPFLGAVASDPSLRGLFDTMALTVEGIKRGVADEARLSKVFSLMAETGEAVLAGQNKALPWRSIMSADKPQPRDLRKFILTQPVLDYGDLEPGAKASKVLREMASTLGPDVRVRLTGSVALNDEEFASVAEGTGFATVLSVVLVLVILFLALRSFRLIIPILLTLTTGLIATTAFAMLAVGSLNLISVAFAVMFVGIAVDFGIQFGVRYRDQHHQEPDSIKAMLATARIIALPLALAAGSTALGFLAFMPTDYRGVAELGLIAGAGMLIAFALNITLLPALLALFHPPAEPEAIGYAWAAPVDRFLVTHRRKVLIVAGVLALLSAAIASQLRFDFDPLNLKDPRTESVATLFDIMSDPQATPYTIAILESNLAQAQEVAKKLEALPEVSHAMTLGSFVPEDQDRKLAMIADARMLLDPTLNPPSVAPQPSDEALYASLKKTAEALQSLGADHPAAQQLAKVLNEVVTRHDPRLLAALHEAFVRGLMQQLATIRALLAAQPVTLDDIEDDLRRDWITADSRAKIEVYPKGNARDHRVLVQFTEAVRRIAPEATGAPISIQESGRTVVNAFIKAGIFAVLAISLLAWVLLRSFGDVVRMIAPLLLAGLLTLATMVIIKLPLNFANIIALPLLLSLGVSYAIYFVSYARAGFTNPLQSSMARAVLFSAATTLVAFGSLSLSTHPGTSGMGELLTVALVYSVLVTFLLLPCLLKRQALP